MTTSRSAEGEACNKEKLKVIHSKCCKDKIPRGGSAGFWASKAWHVLAETALANLALEDGLARGFLSDYLPTPPALRSDTPRQEAGIAWECSAPAFVLCICNSSSI